MRVPNDDPVMNGITSDHFLYEQNPSKIFNLYEIKKSSNYIIYLNEDSKYERMMEKNLRRRKFKMVKKKNK